MRKIGIILYRLLCKGRYPFERRDRENLGIATEHEDYSPLPENVSPFLKELVDQLLIKKPDMPPSAFDLLFYNDKIFREAIKI